MLLKKKGEMNLFLLLKLFLKGQLFVKINLVATLVFTSC